MIRVVCVLIFLAILLDAGAQPKRSGKVRKKYRQVEKVTEQLPVVFVHGRVWNAGREPLPGATIVVRGTTIHVNANEDGEYFLQGLPSGVNSIMVSHHGYRTKIIDYFLQEGNNDVYFTLDRDRIMLDPLPVSAQQREQHILEIPGAISVETGKMMELADIRQMDRFSDFVPGFFSTAYAAHRPVYSIRGVSGNDDPISLRPRISVHLNQIPVSNQGISATELYDIDRVEVLRGTHQTLSGMDAFSGAVRIITRKPGPEAGGYISAGLGNYGRREMQGALNVPLFRDKLMVRASGIYDYHDGYIENSAGGSLNGKLTRGGRFALRFEPLQRLNVDLSVYYHEDDQPGSAFINRNIPGTNNQPDIFQRQAALEQGSNLFNMRRVLTSGMEIRLYQNENNFWSSITTFSNASADSRLDGDGTPFPATVVDESGDFLQLSQELRLNFSVKSRTNGIAGVVYRREDAGRSYRSSHNEQHLVYLFPGIQSSLLPSGGISQPLAALPDNPALGTASGLPLPAAQAEENRLTSTNQALELFGDVAFKLRPRLSLLAGLRGRYERAVLSNESWMAGENPSTLGYLSGNYPNLFFSPVSLTEANHNGFSYSGRILLKHDFNSFVNAFAGATHGTRPESVMFNPDGSHEKTGRETLTGLDAGLKWTHKHRYWVDLTGFYQQYRHFMTFSSDSLSGSFNLQDKGKATAYGIELSTKALVLENTELFVNYNWLVGRFDSTDMNGSAQEYAGNRLRLTPEHGISAGFIARRKVHSGMDLFLSSVYAWKSRFWFDDANSSGLEQPAFGVLYASAGLEFKKPALTIAITGSNILDSDYLIHAGVINGSPVAVPGPPAMFGIRLMWRF